MITERKAANAVGGKTARACDSCLRRRARWFCAADDAFLCQSCDASVHSANQLASRHERVRLETSSHKAAAAESTKGNENSAPAWHQGFTRKARTPRHPKPTQLHGHETKDQEIVAKPFPLLVPEISSGEETSLDENEAQLLYRVPVLDPFAAELCSHSNETDQNINLGGDDIIAANELHELLNNDEGCDLDLPGFLASEAELAEFAADVESLLGTGFDEESCAVEDMGGLLDCKKEDGRHGMDVWYQGKRSVKVENDGDDDEVQAVIACQLDPVLDMAREAFDWNFDYASPMTGEEEEEEKVIKTATIMDSTAGSKSSEARRRLLLRLNYDGVITAWASQGCPWTTGTRPDLNPDDCWLEFMATFPGGINNQYGGGGGRSSGGSDGGREARVSRYREKRRTRLFSKKIRYEVRKLNAEKRPRMKGRFVKRTAITGGPTSTSAFPNYLMNK